ncbi:MAG: hypothetical protein ACR2LZ_07690 [Pyrinomonadaceae bacterium]
MRLMKRTTPQFLSKLLLLVCSYSFGVGSECVAQEALKPGEIKVAYDAQSDTTKVLLNPMIVASRKHQELRLGAFSSSKGKTIVKPKDIALVFVSLSVSAGEGYENARKLTVTADARKFPFGGMQRSVQTINGVAAESLLTVVPYGTFLEIVYAKKVSLKIGLTEVELTPDHIKTLRAAASYMAP